MKHWLYILVFCLLAEIAFGQITASSCSSSAVQTAFNAVTSSTATVTIPACSSTGWTTQVSLTVPSGSTGLSVIGAGSQSTTGGGDVTVITDNDTSDQALLQINLASTGTFRMSGITFQGGSGGIKDAGMINIQGPGTVRLDHDHFNFQTYASAPRSFMVNIGSNVIGVMDHSILDQSQTSTILFVNGTSNTAGNTEWTLGPQFGTNQFFFLEDNLINGNATPPTPIYEGRAGDCWTGGRYVVRFNTITETSGPEEHATGHSGDDRGCRAQEVYGNLFQLGSGQPTNGVNYDMIDIGGGATLAWGNSAPGVFKNVFNIDVTRKDNGTYNQSAPPAGWGYCGTTFNGTGSAWDYSATTALGYPCLDQPGYGKGDLLSYNPEGSGSGSFPQKCNETQNSACNIFTGQYPRQEQEPMYFWNNNASVASGWGGAFWSDSTGGRVTANVDYYPAASGVQTSAISPFSGATGTGWGTLANRPTTCTTGVGYFATDQGSWNKSSSNPYGVQQSGASGLLYICTATNTWSLSYGTGNSTGSPYTYPHPLQSGGSPSFTASPSTVPAHHSGNITVTLTGSGTSWTGSTAFSLSGVTGATLVSKSNTSATVEVLIVTTGSGTGTLTITDTTDSISTTITVATATLAISPTSGNTGTAPTLTLTGTNTLWSSETASTLFSESGGTGASLGTPTVSSNTSAAAVLTVGSATGTETITDNSTTATATFTAGTAPPAGTPTLVQIAATPSDTQSQSPLTGSSGTIQACFANSGQVGNTVIVRLTTGQGTIGDIAVADDGSNTYTREQDEIAGSRTLAIYASALAHAMRCVTVTLTPAATDNQLKLYEFDNVGALDVSCTGTVTSGTAPACSSSMTPTVAGDLILTFADVVTFSSTPSAPVKFTAQTGSSPTYTLLDASGTAWTASQYAIDSATSAITPSITVAQAVTRANVVGLAFKAASAGSSFSGVHVNNITFYDPGYEYSGAGGTAQTFQFPCTGNNLYLMVGQGASSSTSNITSISADSNSNTWAGLTNLYSSGDGFALQWWHAESATCNGSEQFTVNFTTAPTFMLMVLFDVSNSGGYDTAATCGSGSTPCAINSTSSSTTSVPGATITPSIANGVILSYANQDYDSLSAISPGNWVGALETCPGSGGTGCGGSATGTNIAYVGSGFEQDGGIFVDYHTAASATSFTWTIANTQSTGIGAYFSSTLNVKSGSAITAPTVTTTTATSIALTSASSGGIVTSNGGASVTSEGVCYATTANPTTPCTSNGTATPFTSSLTGLSVGTLYYYRAFATNSAGTGYGSDLSFTTLTQPNGSLSPTTLTYSSTTAGLPSASQAITLSNTGTSPLAISGIAVTGNYTQSNNCFPSLVGSSTCTINVVFTPGSSGTLTGTLTVTDNSGGIGGSTQTASLTGTGASCSATFTSGATGAPLFGGLRSDPCPILLGNIPNLWTTFSTDNGATGAGKCTTNALGQVICRATDSTTATVAGLPQMTNPSGGDSDERWMCGAYSAGLCTQDSGFMWGGLSQGITYVSLFNAANATSGTATSPFTQLKSGGSPYTIPSKAVAASQVTANLVYVLGSTSNCSTTGPCAIQSYNFASCVSSPTSCSPTVTTIYDFAASGNALYCSGAFNNSWNSVFRVSSDDSMFSFGLSMSGGQGTAELEVSYKVGSGYRIANVGTTTICGIAAGTIVGSYGPTGSYTMTGCTLTSPYTCSGGPDEFNIHDSQTFHSNNLIVLSSDNCLAGTCTGTTPPNGNYDEPYVWDQPTLAFLSLGGGQTGGLSGEATYGYNADIHGASPHPQMGFVPVFSGSAFAPYRDSFSVLSTTFLNGFNPNASPLTPHETWQIDNPEDTMPILGATTSYGASLTTANNMANNGCVIPSGGWSGTPNCGFTNPFSGPGVDELLVWQTSTVPGSTSASNTCAVTNGTTITGQNGAPPCSSSSLGRIGPTYNSTVSPYFDAQNTTIDWSQSGRYYSIVSDWMATLGTYPTGQTPVFGGLAWVASHDYNSGDVITPSSNNSLNCSFTSSGGVSGSTQPTTWVTSGACSATVTESSGSGVVWTRIGSIGEQNMRYDVFVGATGPSGLSVNTSGPVLIKGNAVIK